MEQFVAAIDDVTVALRAAAVTGSVTDDEDGTRERTHDADRRVEQVLLAQRRTNELLELALGLAFDAEVE